MRFLKDESTWNNDSGVLTASEIKHYEVVTDFAEDSCQIASYDLRLGSCHYVYDNSREGESSGWSLLHIGSEKEFDRLNNIAGSTQKYKAPETLRHTLVIPPYGSAIIELKEIVDTFTAAIKYNKLIVGRFDLKLSQVYQALISQQATQVEPLYKGKLYCFIHNLSDHPIYLKEDDRIATIEFTYAGAHLSDRQRKLLIEKNKNTEAKYADSLYASRDHLGIGEVRWFYEQNRLPSDCGLNRLHTRVTQEVTGAVKQFDQQFENYFEKEGTLLKITERVNTRIQEQLKNWRFLITTITFILSLGIGSLLLMFYQDLVGVIERQNMYSIYLSGTETAKDLSQATLTFARYPWLFLYILLLIAIISIAILFYLYCSSKMKKSGSEEINVLAELAALREETKVLRSDLTDLQQCYNAAVNNVSGRKP